MLGHGRAQHKIELVMHHPSYVNTRVMFGEFVGGKGYSGGQEKDWMDHLKEDMSVFGMKFEGWRKAAQKAGSWFSTSRGGSRVVHAELA